VYDYDPTGNLVSRQDKCVYEQPVEKFGYDSLNRLTDVELSGESSLSLTYDAIGNIISKSVNDDQRDYKYCGANPPSPTPTPVTNRCVPDAPGGCNVCQLCCKSYLKNQDDCDQCVRTECPKKAISLSSGGTCTIATGAGPHAVRQILVDEGTVEAVRVEYDGVGNAVSTTEVRNPLLSRSLAYNAGGKVTTATRGTHASTWLYNHAGAAVQRTDTIAGISGSTVTVVLPGFEHVTKPDGSVECRHHVVGGVLLKSGCGTNANFTALFFGFDQQGSINVITDATGKLLDGDAGRHSYDPFGRRRNGNGSVAPRDHDWGVRVTDEGYTGHTELDGLGLVQTPARMYDPYLGRFLSADPTIQTVKYSQSINRYSYAGNNPLAVTDPSGFSWLSSAWHGVTHFLAHPWKTIEHALLHNAIFRDIVMAAFSILPGLGAVAGSLLYIALDALGSAAFSTVMVKLEGGSWGDALKAGLIAGAESVATA
jgi:RHS repeat-associated protein